MINNIFQNNNKNSYYQVKLLMVKLLMNLSNLLLKLIPQKKQKV